MLKFVEDVNNMGDTCTDPEDDKDQISESTMRNRLQQYQIDKILKDRQPASPKQIKKNKNYETSFKNYTDHMTPK